MLLHYFLLEYAGRPREEITPIAGRADGKGKRAGISPVRLETESNRDGEIKGARHVYQYLKWMALLVLCCIELNDARFYFRTILSSW